MTCRQAASEVERDKHNEQNLEKWVARAEIAEAQLVRLGQAVDQEYSPEAKLLKEVFGDSCSTCHLSYYDDRDSETMCNYLDIPIVELVHLGRWDKCPYIAIDNNCRKKSVDKYLKRQEEALALKKAEEAKRCDRWAWERAHLVRNDVFIIPEGTVSTTGEKLRPLWCVVISATPMSDTQPHIVTCSKLVDGEYDSKQPVWDFEQKTPINKETHLYYLCGYNL